MHAQDCLALNPAFPRKLECGQVLIVTFVFAASPALCLLALCTRCSETPLPQILAWQLTCLHTRILPSLPCPGLAAVLLCARRSE